MKKKFTLVTICLILSISFSGCGESVKESEGTKAPSDDKEEFTDLTEPNETEESNDILHKKLDGIEKVFVRNNQDRLRALKAFNENPSVEEDETADFGTISIVEVDSRNGFIEYTKREIDCVFRLTYWIQSNGDYLIAETETCTTMFKHGEIKFLTYSQSSDSFSEIETGTVIPSIDLLNKKLSNALKDGGVDYEYILPSNGMDISFVIDGQATILKWQNGTFAVQ